MRSLSLEGLFTHGARHALDYLGMWTQHSRARVVRIESTDTQVIQQCLLRLPPSIEVVSLVADGKIDDAPWPWQIHTGSYPQADVVLYPFSLETKLSDTSTPLIIGCFQNAFSYRKLLHPRHPMILLSRVRNQIIRMGYVIENLVGIYPPDFMFWWTLSLLTGSCASSLSFRFKNQALLRLSHRYGMGRFVSSILVFRARR